MLNLSRISGGTSNSWANNQALLSRYYLYLNMVLWPLEGHLLFGGGEQSSIDMATLAKRIGTDTMWQQLPNMVEGCFGIVVVSTYCSPLHTQSLPPSP